MMNNSPPQHQLLDPRLLPPDSAQSRAAYGHPPLSVPALGFASQDVRRQSGSRQEQHHQMNPDAPGRVEQPYFGIPASRSSEDAIASIEIPETGGEDDYMNDSPTHDPHSDAKRPRACEACRGLKVRCDQDPNHPDQPCKRCAKAGRQCVITQPTRKRQKKADSRVAELEKKLDALTAVLQAQQQNGKPNLQQLGQGAQYGPSGEASGPGGDPMPPVSSTQQRSDESTPDKELKLTWPGAAPSGKSNKRRRIEEPKDHLYGKVPEDPLLGRVQDMYRRGETDSEKILGDPLERNVRLDREEDIRRLLYHTDPEAVVSRIRTLVEPAVAEAIFNRYTKNLAPHMPAVVFPPDTTADEVLKNKPVLFLCILAASGFGLIPQDVQNMLNKEAIAAIADCVLRHAAKSLELIQSMQVTVLWYRPPEKAEQTNFYQLIHMAAVMALDIGLGKRFNAAKARRGFWGPGQDLAPGTNRPMPLVDSDTVEARRAWLTCYYLCASTSMVLRRPNLIRWTNYMHECINVLETSPDALPSDRYLVQHVKIQHICEDIGSSFSMDDSSATSISITDPKVTYALTILEKQLKEWESSIPEDLKRPELMYFRDVTSLYLHEIALHVNHNTDDFQIPFTEATLKSGNLISETLTPKQMAAVEACLTAVHSILDTYCGFSREALVGLPTLLYFVRVVYAVVVLIKMHIAATLPDSELGKILKPEDLKVQEHLERLWNLFETMSKEDAWRQHHKVLRILGVLRQWFGTHQSGEPPREDNKGTHANWPIKDVGEEKEEAGARKWPPKNENKLHVLSEAATGGSGAMKQQQQGHQKQDNTSWTFDSPTAIPYPQRVEPGRPRYKPHSKSQQNTAPSAFSPSTFASQSGSGESYGSNPPSATFTSLDSFGNSPSNFNVTTNNNGFYGVTPNPASNNSASDVMTTSGAYDNNAGGMGDMDSWTARLDFQQALDVALHDFDMSGDFGDWILGDGPGAFTLPEGAGGMGGNGGRW